jgi:predicted Zn finger-like uncharacterized protein
MNLITRCPACATSYQVVPDQIKIAQGWLRCGQCQHVFDSTGVVLVWPDLSQSASDVLTAQDVGERLVIDKLLKQEDRSPPPTPTAVVDSFEEALSTFNPQRPLFAKHETSPEFSGGAVQSATHRTARYPFQSWVPILGVLVLLLALALQWLWIQRNMLVAKQPSVLHILHAACRFLDCEISPAQMRDGVVIENSSLTPTEGGFLLNWSVRNAKAQELQMPALVLALMDAQDKVLVSRVLLVAQQDAPLSLASGQVWDGQLRFTLEYGLTPSGYRLFSFYP